MRHYPTFGKYGCLCPSSIDSSTSMRLWIVYVWDSNREDWYLPLLQSVRQRRAGPIARMTFPVLNPTTKILGATQPAVPKLPPSEGSPGIDGSQNAINVVANQYSVFPFETERVGKSAGGLVVDGTVPSKTTGPSDGYCLDLRRQGNTSCEGVGEGGWT